MKKELTDRSHHILTRAWVLFMNAVHEHRKNCAEESVHSDDIFWASSATRLQVFQALLYAFYEKKRFSIAKTMRLHDMSRTTINRVLKDAIHAGYLDDSYNPTQKSWEYARHRTAMIANDAAVSTTATHYAAMIALAQNDPNFLERHLDFVEDMSGRLSQKALTKFTVVS